MPLQRRPTSKWWYGRWEVNGKPQCINFGLEIKGCPPKKRGDLGDPVFEKSKSQAQWKFDQVVADSKKQRQSEKLIQSLHEIRTGHRIGSVSIANIQQAWDDIPRKRPLNSRYRQCCHAVLRAFSEYIKGHHTAVSEMAGVTREMARGFLVVEEKRGITEKTWNYELKLLRATFKHS